MLRVVFVAMAVAVASAAVVGPGPCPDVTPVQNFDVPAYVGLWYEIGKFPTIDERGGQCAKAQYTQNQDGTVHVKNSNVVNGVLEAIEGSARFADDANKSAKLIVTLNFGPQSRDQNLQVVATDYSNYAIAYNCRVDASTNQSNMSLWVLSRKTTLDGAAKEAVDAWFKANPAVDQSKLEFTDHSEKACQYTSTGVVSERPSQ